MEVREKLVELLYDADKACNNKPCVTCKYQDKRFFCKIHFYIDQLIANGVTMLPCKIGDVVWGIKKYNKGQEVKQGIVHQMFFGEDMRLCICVKNVCRGELGVNVFLTKKEAEAHLPQPPKGE